MKTKQGFASIVPLLILAVGLLVALFLLGQKTGFFNRASNLTDATDYAISFSNNSSASNNTSYVTSDPRPTSPNSLVLKMPLTIEGWFKTPKPTSGNYIHVYTPLALHATPSIINNNYLYRLSFETQDTDGSTRPIFNLMKSNPQPYDHNNYLSVGSNNTIRMLADEWSHIAITASNSGNICYVQMYINGKMADSTNMYSPNCQTWTDSPTEFTLAKPINGTSGIEGYYYPGQINELRISRVVRYKNDFTPQKTNIISDPDTIALWHFDQSLIDNSGNGNDGTGNGTISYIAQAPSPWGNSMQLDGTNYLIATNSASLNAHNGFTVESWIKFKAPSLATWAWYNEHIIHKAERNKTSYYIKATILADPYRQKYDVYYNFYTLLGNAVSCSGQATRTTHVTDLTADQLESWQHIAGVIQNDGTVDLFVNGKKEVSFPEEAHATSICPTSTPIDIGGRVLQDNYGSGLYEPFNGQLDDVRISTNSARYTDDFVPIKNPFNVDSSTTILYHFNSPPQCNISSGICYTANNSSNSFFGQIYGNIQFPTSTVPYSEPTTHMGCGTDLTCKPLPGAGPNSCTSNAECVPTATYIGKLSSEVKNNAKVILKWQSLNEINTLGFNLYRATRKDDALFGEFSKINPKIIPAKQIGSISGAFYQHTDITVKAGKIYRYKVEVVGANGKTLEWSQTIKVVVPTK